MFGLREEDIELIKEAVSKFPEIEEAIVFGSRALGNYKKASDIDICIKGVGISSDTVLRLREILEENNNMPYFFDVVNYSGITNSDLIDHIDKKGVVLFKIKHP